MTKKKKILLIISVTLFVLLLFANVIISKVVTNKVNTSIAEGLKQDLGADLKVDAIKVNLFRGLVSVSNIEAATAPVFDEDPKLIVEKIRVNVGLLSLLKGVINVSEAVVENASVTIARISGSQVNAPIPAVVPVKPSAGSGAETPLTEEPSAEAVASGAGELAEMSINNVSIETELNYIDYDFGEEPFRIGFDIALEADGIKTYGAVGPESGWGTFNLTAALKDDPTKFVSDIQAQIAPVVNPMMASFNLDATIKNINLTEMPQLADKFGVTTSDLSIEIHLKCRDGVFDRINSTIKVVCMDPKPAGKHADKAQYMSAIKRLDIPLNVGGTLEKVDVGNWEEILFNALIANFANIAVPVLEKLNEEGGKLDGAKIEKEVNRGLRKIGLDKLFE